jgi:hypothetical protein
MSEAYPSGASQVPNSMGRLQAFPTRIDKAWNTSLGTGKEYSFFFCGNKKFNKIGRWSINWSDFKIKTIDSKEIRKKQGRHAI